ncbi:MAG: energy-coupled thiamine transporter ThiT [Coriobacteriales bacterium]|jgi:thiamine transporter|nr:energy-coupled thiamine transporter ThiT [Coriobacteriales bacterium]
MRDTRILILVEVALAVALATVLSFLQIRLPINLAGGSIQLAMLPLAVVALRRGALAGATAGALFGLIDLLLEPFVLFPLQVILDYPGPYLLFGLGVGLFSGVYRRAAEAADRRVTGGFIARSTVITIAAVVVGGLLRLVSHVLSGVFFFAEYAADFFAEHPALVQAGPLDAGVNAWIYSIIYNLLYIVPSVAGVLACALVVMPVLAKAVPVRHAKAASTA